MIHAVQKIIIQNKPWYYQEFSPDSLCADCGFNLYDSNGDFVDEFATYEDMLSRILISSAE